MGTIAPLTSDSTWLQAHLSENATSRAATITLTAMDGILKKNAMLNF